MDSSSLYLVWPISEFHAGMQGAKEMDPKQMTNG